MEFVIVSGISGAGKHIIFDRRTVFFAIKVVVFVIFAIDKENGDAAVCVPV